MNHLWEDQTKIMHEKEMVGGDCFEALLRWESKSSQSYKQATRPKNEEMIRNKGDCFL